MESAPTQCEVDPIDEAMQMTVQLVDSQGNGRNLVNDGEQRVDNVTNVEVNEMEEREVVAEEQRVATQTAHGTKQHPTKQGEMRREGADESGGEVRGSAYTEPDEAMKTMAPPPSLKRTKTKGGPE